MKNNSIFTTIILAFFFSYNIHAQLWEQEDAPSLRNSSKSERLIIPKKYRLMHLDFERMRDQLSVAEKGSQHVVIKMPIADGSIQQFKVQEASVFSDRLAAKYPEIKSYKGKGIDDPSAYVRFGYSHKGFHAIIFSSKYGTMYIDSYARGNTEDYIVYHKKDFDSTEAFECLVDEDTQADIKASTTNQKAGDCQLRTYRLALACTGEYAMFHGGSLEDVMAEFNIAMTRVNGIYEKDVSLTMVLIENNDELIFLDGASDPYTNNSGSTMLGENQETIDDIIGATNYDIGHVFSTGGGGIASLRSPCGGGKARGVTGLGNPVGDPFYVDYVAHEIGHQFGGNHTQNNSCNRNGSTAMEPGSASTIMGYAGICIPNVANNSDDHFHAISIEEMSDFIINGNGANCAEITSLDNSAPTVSLPATSYTVPISTPLALTAIGVDEDEDLMTYCWEQMDNEIGIMPPMSTNVVGPMFRSNSPSESPTRYLPSLFAVINNFSPTWEVLPSVDRTMDWRVTVRDNNIAVGCTAEDNMTIDFSSSAGPFLVTEPNSAVEWNATEEQTVTWDVAGTDMAPVSCAEVDIYLSTDGGFSYPILIAEGVPNSGSLDIVVPDEQTDLARIMVKCHDNIFFDISNENFTIRTPFSIDVSSNDNDICSYDVLTLEISSEAFNGFSDEVELSLLGLPAGATATIGVTSITPPESTTLVISDFPDGQGLYNLSLVGTSMGLVIEEQINVRVWTSDPSPTTLVSPVDGMAGLDEIITLEWNTSLGLSSYNIEISTNPSFSTVVESRNHIQAAEYTTENLQSNTVYYWRVLPNSFCAATDYSEIFAFQTAGENCDSYPSENPPIVISDNSENTIVSNLSIPDIEDFLYVKLNVGLQHSWLGDLVINLIAPDGTSFGIIDRPGVPQNNFGCEADNINATFRDDAIKTSDFIEENCESLQGDYQSISPLNIISTLPEAGIWSLQVLDRFVDDGGSLDTWALEFCNETLVGEPALTNNTLFVNKSTSVTISKMLLNTTDTDVEKVIYTVMSLPVSGSLEIDRLDNGMYESMVIGDAFAQIDVDNLLVRYTHTGNDQIEDGFFFDLIDSKGRWTHNEPFSIFILQDDFSAIAEVSAEINCNGDDNGALFVSVFGGLEPYAYSIDSGISFQQDPQFIGLSSGNYEIIVKDATGTEIATNTTSLIDPSPITITTEMMGYNLVINAEGGTGNYEYSINGINFQESNTFQDVDNGMFTITVVDANECSGTESIEVMVDAISYVTTTIAACSGTDSGAISFDNVMGGIPPYEYSIDGSTYQSTPLFTTLAAGMYDTYVRDSGGKILNLGDVEVTVNEEIVITALGENGIISVEVKGGTKPYVFSIDNGATFQLSNVFENVDFGEYNVLVLDAIGCPSTMQVIIVLSDVDDLEDKFTFALFPNPVDRALSILLEGEYLSSNKIRLEIIDNLGRVRYHEAISASAKIRKDIDVSALSSGMYFILIYTEDKIARAEFVKM